MPGLALSGGRGSVTCELVRAMNVKLYGGFIAAASLAALILATNETSAAGPGMSRGGGAGSSRPLFRPTVGRSLRHRGRGNGVVGAYWPDAGVYGPSDAAPATEVPAPNSGDIHYTYTQDYPWDAVHRYPPIVAPSDRPYVPDCPSQNVTVPGHGGKDQVVTITRCY
jgi:hypothetical protein